VDCASMERG